MKNLTVLGPLLALAVLLVSGRAAAEDHTGLSINLTPVLLFPTTHYRIGGGANPELKYTLDLGPVRLSAGGRVGAYYAKNLFGTTVMPTARLLVPLGPIEPYVSAGVGYGWLPKLRHEDVATMGRVGVVFRFSKRIAVALEATLQQIDRSNFNFASFGSMMAFEL